MEISDFIHDLFRFRHFLYAESFARIIRIDLFYIYRAYARACFYYVHRQSFRDFRPLEILIINIIRIAISVTVYRNFSIARRAYGILYLSHVYS